MPILWRYLTEHFFKIFFLSVVSFILILLTSRMAEIAHFASFGAPLELIGLFTLLQIPFILPIAIPIGCLIAAILLMQKMSSDHELTALRSGGFTLRAILAPLLFMTSVLSVLNFYMVSELSTFSHLKANLLKNEIRTVNPLLLLHNRHLMRLQGITYDALGPSKLGQIAKDVVIGIPSSQKGTINLVVANQLESNAETFSAKNLSLISPFATQTEGPDHLLVENIQESASSLENFSSLIQKKVFALQNDALSMSLLLIRLKEYQNPSTELDPKVVRKNVASVYTEIMKRFSAGLAPFTFTLLGISFGISLNRIKKRLSLLLPIFLAALYLVTFFAAKSLESKVALAAVLYFVPHGLIIISSLIKLRRISYGLA